MSENHELDRCHRIAELYCALYGRSGHDMVTTTIRTSASGGNVRPIVRFVAEIKADYAGPAACPTIVADCNYATIHEALGGLEDILRTHATEQMRTSEEKANRARKALERNLAEADGR